MRNSNFRVMKQVENKDFSVALVQSVNDTYYVLYGADLESLNASECLKDYGIASYLFDLKYEEFNNETH